MTFQSSENSYWSMALGFHDFNDRKNKYRNFPNECIYMVIYWWKSKTIRHIKLNKSIFQSKFDGRIDFNFKCSLFFIYYSCVLWSSFLLLLTSLYVNDIILPHVKHFPSLNIFIPSTIKLPWCLISCLQFIFKTCWIGFQKFFA